MDDVAMTAEIVEMIQAGDLDVGLFKIEEAVFDRRTVLGLPNKPYGDKKEDLRKIHFKVGDTIEVIGKLRPNYLFGSQFRIKKVNPKTVLVYVPKDSKFRRFSGTNVRIPKTAVKVVEP